MIILICSACFIAKQHIVFNCKDAFSIICVSPGSAETLFRWGEKIKQLLIAQSFSNANNKNYENQKCLLELKLKMLGILILSSRHSVYLGPFRGTKTTVSPKECRWVGLIRSLATANATAHRRGLVVDMGVTWIFEIQLTWNNF